MTKKEQQIFDAYKSDVAIFKSEVVDLTMENEKLRKRIAELEKQLAIRDKALELACKYSSFRLRFGVYPEPIFFLEQAEEELKKAKGK